MLKHPAKDGEEFGRTERIRWKLKTRRFISAEIPLRDADGSTRMVAEEEWIAVVYPPDPGLVFVETLERAVATQRFATKPGNRNESEILAVSRLHIESSVGKIEWEAQSGLGFERTSSNYASVHSFDKVFPGTLVLPDGTRRASIRGSGFFDVANLVHAYKAWRDADVEEGWTVITEVDLGAPDEWRPLLAALPLLFFTTPPKG